MNKGLYTIEVEENTDDEALFLSAFITNVFDDNEIEWATDFTDVLSSPSRARIIVDKKDLNRVKRLLMMIFKESIEVLAEGRMMRTKFYTDS